MSIGHRGGTTQPYCSGAVSGHALESLPPTSKRPPSWEALQPRLGAAPSSGTRGRPCTRIPPEAWGGALGRRWCDFPRGLNGVLVLISQLHWASFPLGAISVTLASFPEALQEVQFASLCTSCWKRQAFVNASSFPAKHGDLHVSSTPLLFRCSLSVQLMGKNMTEGEGCSSDLCSPEGRRRPSARFNSHCDWEVRGAHSPRAPLPSLRWKA